MNKNEIYFIDPRLIDFQSVVNSLPTLADVVVLDANSDGLDQISSYLYGRTGVDALHVISHGRQGAVYLGKTALDNDNLAAHELQLVGIGNSLSESGDILLYGCNVAQGELGLRFIKSLAQWTGTDVTASIDATGAEALGGDWALEESTGVVEAKQISDVGAAGLLSVNSAPIFKSGSGKVSTEFQEVWVEFSSMALQPSGNILVIGITEPGAQTALAKYSTDGIFDSAFFNNFQTTADSSSATFYGWDVIPQNNYGILVGYSGSSGSYGVSRHDDSGKLDVNFGDAGNITTPGSVIATQSDGNILIAGGDDATHSFSISRYNREGTLDPDFGLNGSSNAYFGDTESWMCQSAVDIFSQTDGKILVCGLGYSKNGGAYANFSYRSARFNSDGTLDTTFGTDGKVTTKIPLYPGEPGVDFVMQNDGKILLAGTINADPNRGGNLDFLLLRFNTDGSLDDTFGIGGQVNTNVSSSRYGNGLATDSARAVVLQADGKILVAGYTYNGDQSDFALVRYNINGSLDTTFGLNGRVTTDFGSYHDQGRAVSIQTDGKILVSGSSRSQWDFTHSAYALARYNSDGSLDKTFSPEIPFEKNIQFIENSSPVLLNSNIWIQDLDLSTKNSYDGAILALSRFGNESAEDAFSAVAGGTLSLLSPGSYFSVDGATIGRVTTNSAGKLVLAFNANATQSLVNHAMQQIAYTNTSNAPPASVQIDWTFNDGNTGAQGLGGPLSVTGTTKVQITASNDSPYVAVGLPDQVLVFERPFSYVVPAGTFVDPDLESLTYSVKMADGTGLPPWLAFNTTTRTFSGTPGTVDAGIFDVQVFAKDGANASASSIFRITVAADTTAPTVGFSDNLVGIANLVTNSLQYALTFNEVVTGLEVNDFSVTNGTVSSVAGSGSAWTVNVIPALGVSSGAVGLTLKAGAVSDAAGNLNVLTTNSSQAIDTVAPVAPKLLTNAAFHSLVNPQVTLQTSLGAVAVELFPEASPITVANMLAYVNSGFYDNTMFHMVKPGFLAQGGGNTSGHKYNQPTYGAITLESNNGLSNLRGTIAMARTDVADSATSQFFVNQVDNTFLNYSSASSPGYAVFGKVVSGLAVIDSIAKVQRYSNDVPVVDVTIGSSQQTLAGSSITNSASLAVVGLEVGAQWSYSLDSGSNWTAGAGSSLVVPVGDYAPGAIQVRQTDLAGNVSLSPGRLTSALLVETTAPTVVTFNPGNEAAGVAVGNNLVFTFSEAIVKGTGTVILKTSSGGTVASYDATSSNLIVSGNTLTINPSADLAYGTNYKIDVVSGAVKDLAGNSFVGASGYTFSTVGGETFIGTDRADNFAGSSGVDMMAGGPGNDTYTVDTQSDLVFENPDEGNDTVIASTSFYLYDNIENLTLASGAGSIFASANALDNLVTGNEADNLLLGWDGNDRLIGNAGNDILYGVEGNDTLQGEAGVDVLVGGNGTDILDGGAHPDSIYGEAGNDTLYGGTGFATDILVGGDGNDALDGSASVASGQTRNQGDYDLMDGGAGDDTYHVDTPADLTFEAAGGGTDTVIADINGGGYYLYANVENLILTGSTPFGVGNELDNRLTGSAQGNWLLGGAGNDTIQGMGGYDVLFGQEGTDTFVFERGTGGDVIGDFQRGVDKIDLTGLGYSFAQLQTRMVENAGTTAIDLGDGDFVVLVGVAMNTLGASDFVLPPGGG